MEFLASRVNLYRNPWRGVIGGAKLLRILVKAAGNMAQQIQGMSESGQVAEGRSSFGCTIMDPTEPPDSVDAVSCVLATIAIGEGGWKHIPSSLAKAHATLRHGYIPNGLMVAKAPHCLDTSDIAWGHAAVLLLTDDEGNKYPVGCAGGSGLSPEQDHDVALSCLTEVMGAVDALLLDFIAERRSGGGSQRWYNPEDQPGNRYVQILHHPWQNRSLG